MALGKKSKSTAEIGDLATVKVNTATLYDDVDSFYSNDDVTFGAKLGPILAIATSENGELVYSVRGGWVKALAVRIETNPSYNYPESATQERKNSGFWDAVGIALTGVFGVLNARNQPNPPPIVEEDTIENDVNSPKSRKDNGNADDTSRTPTWIFWAGGVLAVSGVLVAIFWPKKPKPQSYYPPINTIENSPQTIKIG